MNTRAFHRPSLPFYLLLSSCITVGAFLRIWPILNLGLSGDDLFHIRLAGVRLANISTRLIDSTFVDVLRYSYRDVHPPLRNIIFHYAFPIAESPMVLRLVSILPGIGLLCATCLYLQELKMGRRAILAAVFLLTFSEEFVHLSQQTRGYMLMFFFSVLAMFFYHRYERTLLRRYLYSGAISACLALLSEYGAILLFLPIFVLSLTNSIISLSERYRRIIAHGVVCLFFGLQMIIILRMNAIPRAQQLDYLEADLGLPFSTQAVKLFQILSNCLLPPNSPLGPVIVVFFLIGLGLLVHQRRWGLLCIATTPSLLMCGLNSAHLHPLQIGRTSLLLAFSVLIPICFFVETVGKRKFANPFLGICVAVFLAQVLSYSNVSEFRKAYRSYGLSGLPRFNYTYTKEELRHTSALLTGETAERNNPKALYIVHSIDHEHSKSIVSFPVLRWNLRYFNLPYLKRNSGPQSAPETVVHETIVRDFSPQFNTLIGLISAGSVPKDFDFSFISQVIPPEDLRQPIWITSRDRLLASKTAASSVRAVIGGSEVLLSYIPEMNLLEISRS